MIVQCDKCKTKFRIADEKVSTNGVKVRCSRCAHVFVVRPEGVADSGRPTTTKVPTQQVTSFAQQSEKRLSAPPSKVPTIPSSSMMAGLPTARARIPAAATASSLEAAAALGFSGLPEPPKKPPLPPLEMPSGLPDFGDPLRAFTVSEALTEKSKLTATTQQSIPPPPPLPFDRFDDSFDPDPFASAPPPLPPLPKKAAPEPPAPTPLPKFAKSELPSFPGPLPEAEASDRFPAPPDMSSFDTGFHTEMNLEGFDADQAHGDFPPPPPSLSQPPITADMGDIPGLLPPGADSDDPFAGVDPEAPASGSMGAYSDFNVGRDELGALAPPRPPSGEALARIDLGRAGIPVLDDGTTHHEQTAIARAYEPGAVRAKTALQQITSSDDMGRWPTLLGIAAGLVVAFLFVPGVGESVTSLLGMSSGGTLVTTGGDPLVPGSLETVSSQKTFVRAYPTADGHELLVVGGDAMASESVGGVEAVVVVLDGDRVVERRTAPVGVTISESMLVEAKSESDLAVAYVGQPAVSLEVGRATPFMIVFWTPPRGAEEKSYRVAFVKAGASARAANAQN